MQFGGSELEETRLIELLGQINEMPSLIEIGPLDKEQYRNYTQEAIYIINRREVEKDEDHKQCIEIYEALTEIAEVNLIREKNYIPCLKNINWKLF